MGRGAAPGCASVKKYGAGQFFDAGFGLRRLQDQSWAFAARSRGGRVFSVAKRITKGIGVLSGANVGIDPGDVPAGTQRLLGIVVDRLSRGVGGDVIGRRSGLGFPAENV